MSDGNERLEIGVTDEQIALMRLLAAELDPPYRILYVLLVPRPGQSAGRYESQSLTSAGLADFFDRYRVIFEQDGRHALWIQSESGQLVLTPHDIIYGYGPADIFRALLLRRDFAEKPFSIPAPHAHHYHEQFDPVIRDLLSHYSWKHHPLHDMDEET